MGRLQTVLRREDGMTLTELLVSLPLLAVLLMALTLTLTTTQHWGDQVQEDSVVTSEARAVIDGIAKDLRQGYAGNTPGAIESMSPTTITFDSPDRSTPFHLRRISYRLAGGQIDRQSATSSNTAAPWTFPTMTPWAKQMGSVVSSTMFTYFDASGAATTTPTAVETVQIALTVTTGSSQGRKFTYTSTVSLRKT